MGTKFRIVEHSPLCWEPQVRRWWWPFWQPLYRITYTGSPALFDTKVQAESAIEDFISPPARKYPVVHPYCRNTT